MKKFNYLLLGLAGLSLASCSQEDLSNPAEGTYQITVNLPKDMATRAIGDQITAPQTLNYTLFTSDGTFVQTGSQDLGKGVTSTTISLPLVKGNSYKLAFFSSATGNTAYSYDTQTGVVTVKYENMTYGEGINVDQYDCFSANYEIEEVSGPISETITLKRPVAQINWGTNDLTSSAVASAFGENAANLRTTLSMTVAAPNTLNVLTGDVSTVGEVEPIPAAALPSDNDFPVPGYSYLAMQYVLVPADGTTADLTLNVSGQADKAPIEIEVSSAPLQANYRTNIYGALLTDQANLNVELSSTWGVPDNNIANGARVEVTKDGTFNCTTPVLPAGVTPEMMKDQNAVAVALKDGQPYYVTPITGKTMGEAIQAAIEDGCNEFYFAQNATISYNSHAIKVPATGLTIHGNGATLSGGEQDISIETGTGYSNFIEGSTVDVNVENLNGVKIWGNVSQAVTINVNLTNCSYTNSDNASGAFIMVRGNNEPDVTINFNVNNCLVQKTQVGIYTSYLGTVNVTNCKFTNVGIPINIAKKEVGASNITVSNCIFTTCGITPNDPNNSAWNYSAPVRVVDNAGPADAINLQVKNCTFTGTLSKYDILLWDYRTNEVRTSYPVNLTVQGCSPANPIVYTIDKEITMGPGYPDPNSPNS